MNELIMGIFLLTIALIFSSKKIIEYCPIYECIFYFTVFSFSLPLILYYIIVTPSAMDVYRGKTELRITYEGKTPIDSVVVYKK